jgi:hypothetical protein
MGGDSFALRGMATEERPSRFDFDSTPQHLGQVARFRSIAIGVWRNAADALVRLASLWILSWLTRNMERAISSLSIEGLTHASVDPRNTGPQSRSPSPSRPRMYWSRSVSADRKAKIKKQEERDRRQRAKWVETYERILPLVGARDLFQRLPEPSREHIRRLRFPDPEVSYGDELNRADEREYVREAVSQTLDQFTFKTSDGHEISARDCFRVVFSLREAINQLWVEPPDGSLALLAAETRKKLGAVFDELINEQLVLLFLNLDMALTEFTRIDTAIYWYEPKYERVGPGKGLLRIILHKLPPDRIDIITLACKILMQSNCGLGSE